MKHLLMTLLIAVLPFGVAAQTPTTGANGGAVVVMEGHPIEIVARGQELIFYILEDDAKSPTLTAGFSARAVIQDGGRFVAHRTEHVCRQACYSARHRRA